MSENKLRTAVLGLGDSGQLLLDVASKADYFQIEAVADKDVQLSERLAERYKCKAYDDYRQLIMQNQLECLLVAAGMHSCDEHIKTAMRKKFNILKLAPLARCFEEGVELVRLAEEVGVRFAVGNPSRFSRGFLALREFLRECGADVVFMMTGTCTVGGVPQAGWQTDPKLAGGGVLLYDCYKIIDQVLWHLGVPQQVYCVTNNTAGDRQQRQYLTEDTALVMMKFTDTLIGSIIASRAFGPERNFLKVYCKDKILTVSDRRFTVSDRYGQAGEEMEFDGDEVFCMTQLLENFAVSIVLPEENKLCSSGRDNLRNMAVVESAYLSARTGMPEEPGRILGMEQSEAINIWPGHK